MSFVDMVVCSAPVLKSSDACKRSTLPFVSNISNSSHNFITVSIKFYASYVFFNITYIEIIFKLIFSR